MAARSSGVFPREKFDLDATLALTTSPAAAPIELKTLRTIRVVVIGAAGVDDGGVNKVSVVVGGQTVEFGSGELDGNGVGIAHLRGALCDDGNSAHYVLGGGASVAGVYLDGVDNLG
jgi:hypothetical protein